MMITQMSKTKVQNRRGEEEEEEQEDYGEERWWREKRGCCFGLKVTGGREEEQHGERDQRKGGEIEEVFITVCVCSCQLFNERPLLISELILSCSTRLNSGRRWEEVTDEGGRRAGIDGNEMFVLLAAPDFLDFKLKSSF